MSTASRLKLVSAILLVFISVMVAQAQSSDQQSLGDTAWAQRQKSLPPSVIDDDEMTRRLLITGQYAVRLQYRVHGKRSRWLTLTSAAQPRSSGRMRFPSPLLSCLRAIGASVLPKFGRKCAAI